MSWMFFVTAFGTAITLIALVSLTAAIALAGSAFQRSLALIPAATAAGIVFFVWAGGIIMLIAWSAAAVLALPGRSPEATARCGRRYCGAASQAR